MTPWIAIALVTNLLYWAVFVTLAVRRRPGAAAVTLGVMHMLLAAAFSVAPFRSFVDPDYPGFRLGMLHLEHRAATLPTALLLAWALSAALILASRGRGWKLWPTRRTRPAVSASSVSRRPQRSTRSPGQPAALPVVDELKVYVEVGGLE